MPQMQTITRELAANKNNNKVNCRLRGTTWLEI